MEDNNKKKVISPNFETQTKKLGIYDMKIMFIYVQYRQLYNINQMDSEEQNCRNQHNYQFFQQIKDSNDNFSQQNHSPLVQLDFQIQPDFLNIRNLQNFSHNLSFEYIDDQISEFNNLLEIQSLEEEECHQGKEGILPIQTFQSQPVSLSNSIIDFGLEPEGQDQISSSSQFPEKDLFKNIMKVDLKQRKNPNFTKFLISIFNKQTNKLNEQGELEQKHFGELERLRVQYQHRGRRNIRMQALEALFGQSLTSRIYTKQNRKILRQHLGTSQFKYYVAYNPFAKSNNKKQHLLASKVYRLRCMSQKLTGRTQTK